MKNFFKDKNSIKNLKEDNKIIFNQNEIISSNSYIIDQMTGVGGFPLGSIVHIAGEASSGKTTLSLNIANNILKKYKKRHVIYIDAESSLNRYQLKLLINHNTENFWLIEPKSAEEVFDTILQIIEKKNISLVVIDSLAALIPECELKGNISENSGIASLARILSKSLSILKQICRKKKTLLILINQYRTKLNTFSSFMINKKTYPGGRALNYYVDLKFELIRINYIIEKKKIIGSNISISCTKNKIGGIFGIKKISPFIFNKGFNKIREIINEAIENKIIIRNGNWYYYKDQALGQGIEIIIEKLKKNFFLEEYKKQKTI